MLPVFYSDSISIPLPQGHPFPQTKYALLRERVSLLAETGRVSLVAAEEIDFDSLRRVHSPDYVTRASEGGLSKHEQRELGFPWSLGYAARARRSVGATVAAARHVAQHGTDSGWAAHLAGGTHHAFYDRGRGFCLFNDVAVAVHCLRHAGYAPRVLVVDADVHQGDGSARLFADDALVFTLSIHGERNYPRVKTQSDLDVALPDGVEDEAYLPALDRALEEAWERAAPEFVFYLAGADPFVGDKYGRMALTKQGLAERDRRVFERCSREGVRLVTMMAGGYARQIEDTVDVYYSTIERMAAMVENSQGSRINSQ